MQTALTPRTQPLIIGEKNAKQCVILLHGLTTSGAEFLPVAEFLRQRLNHTNQFVLPSAPIRPVQWANGEAVAGWYDLPPHNNFLLDQDENGLLQAVAYVHQLIDELIAQGWQSEQIVLGGFSQGCAISLLAGNLYSRPLGGLFGLSGYLPIEQVYQIRKQSANQHTPVFLAHGSLDPIITVSQAEQAKQRLEQDGHSISWQVYPIGHHVAQPELQDLAMWLNQLAK